MLLVRACETIELRPCPWNTCELRRPLVQGLQGLRVEIPALASLVDDGRQLLTRTAMLASAKLFKAILVPGLNPHLFRFVCFGWHDLTMTQINLLSNKIMTKLTRCCNLLRH